MPEGTQTAEQQEPYPNTGLGKLNNTSCDGKILKAERTGEPDRRGAATTLAREGEFGRVLSMPAQDTVIKRPLRSLQSGRPRMLRKLKQELRVNAETRPAEDLQAQERTFKQHHTVLSEVEILSEPVCTGTLTEVPSHIPDF